MLRYWILKSIVHITLFTNYLGASMLMGVHQLKNNSNVKSNLGRELIATADGIVCDLLHCQNYLYPKHSMNLIEYSLCIKHIHKSLSYNKVEAHKESNNALSYHGLYMWFK